MGNEAEKIVNDYLDRLQSSARARRILAILLVLALLGVAAKSLYDLAPRQYALTISGGDLLGNRHFLAKVLQEEGEKGGLALRIVPTSGSVEALEAVDAGKLDIALIQGGLETSYPNIVHVATVSPELIDFLVRPDITEVKELHGRVINLGGAGGGTRVVAREVLRYSNLQEDIDYSETNYSNEELVALRPAKLPDVVVVVSFAPSAIVDHLVKERGYRLLEMPFPASLALRLGWMADSKVLAYTYSIVPPVPPKDIKTAGVYLHVVANRKVDPRAIYRLLETLYDPCVENRFRQKFDEASQLTLPSGFPISAGTEMFIARKDPVLSVKTVDKIKSLFGLILSVISTVLVVWRWFTRAPKKAAASDDKKFKQALGTVVAIEGRLGDMERDGYGRDELDKVAAELAALRRTITEQAASAKLDDPGLVRTVLLCLAETRKHIREMYPGARPGPGSARAAGE